LYDVVIVIKEYPLFLNPAPNRASNRLIMLCDGNQTFQVIDQAVFRASPIIVIICSTTETRACEYHSPVISLREPEA
jgi:hypothetical protein